MVYDETDDRLSELIARAEGRCSSKDEAEAERLMARAGRLREEAAEKQAEALELVTRAKKLARPSRRNLQRVTTLYRCQLAYRLHSQEGLTLKRSGRVLGISPTRCKALVKQAEREER